MTKRLTKERVKLIKKEVEDAYRHLKEARDRADIIFAMWHLEYALSYLL